MKKIFTLSLMLVCALGAYSQITLEKEYSHTLNVAQVAPGEFFYYSYDLNSSNQLIIYNTDHTVYKVININLPSGATFILTSHLLRNVYSSDNKLGLIYAYNNNGVTFSKVINEDGTDLLSLSGGSPYVRAVGNRPKLFLNKSSQTFIYSLPGSNTTTIMEFDRKYPSVIAPNPVQNSARISYELPYGIASGTIEIFSQDGRLIRSVEIGNAFSYVLIDRDGLASGTYNYVVIANGAAISKHKFVIQ